jgi:hypothetical protein
MAVMSAEARKDEIAKRAAASVGQKVSLPRTWLEFYAALDRAAMQALTSYEEESGEGWQPIESAPKDGRWLLLLPIGTGVPQVGNWFTFVASDYGFWQSHSLKIEATHWAPLPADLGQNAKDATPPASSGEGTP